jgi:hypothetical protein
VTTRRTENKTKTKSLFLEIIGLSGNKTEDTFRDKPGWSMKCFLFCFGVAVVLFCSIFFFSFLCGIGV